MLMFTAAAKQCGTEERQQRTQKGAELEQLSETGQRNIPYHMASRGRSFEGDES